LQPRLVAIWRTGRRTGTLRTFRFSRGELLHPAAAAWHSRSTRWRGRVSKHSR